MVAAGLEAPGVGPPGRVARAVRALEAVPATEGRRQPLDRRPVHDEGAHAFGSEQPLLGGDGVGIRAEILEADRDGAGGLRAVDHDQGAASVGQVSDPGDGQDRAGRPQDVRDRDEPGVGRDRRIERSERPFVVAVVAGVDERDVHAIPVAQRVQRAGRAGVLVGGRHRATAGPPVGQQRRGVHPVGRGMGQRDRVDVGPDHRGDPGPRLRHPRQRLGDGASWARPTSRS